MATLPVPVCPEDWVSFVNTNYGPTLRHASASAARAGGTTVGASSSSLAERFNEATDGSLLMPAEYLIALSRKVR